MFVTGMKVDQVDTTAEWTLGTIGAIFDGSFKVYKYIKYAEKTAATAGVADEVAYYVSDSGYGDNEVTSDLSDSDEVGAGVLQAAMSDGEFGWIQVKGPATLSIALTAGADGDPLTPTGATDGTLDVSAAVTDHVCAVAIDASEKEILCEFPY